MSQPSSSPFGTTITTHPEEMPTQCKETGSREGSSECQPDERPANLPTQTQNM